MNSRQKGARGERAWRDELRAHGYAARRGQQFSGSPDSPDVVCESLPYHFEVKCVEALNLRDAVEQAVRDAGAKTPVVAHKRNHSPWLVTMLASDWFKLIGEGPNLAGDCPTCAAKIPGWWVRGYCAECGGDLPQTPQQIEIERLRDALAEIDDLTGFDYPTMPEAGRAKCHEITREIVLRALTRQNDQAHPQPPRKEAL